MLSTLAAAASAFLLQASAAAPEVEAAAPSGDQITVLAASETKDQDAASAAQPITDKNHPEFMRCRSERVIGSLAKRNKTCMTNREWEVASRTGNRGARDIIESQQVGMNGQ